MDRYTKLRTTLGKRISTSRVAHLVITNIGEIHYHKQNKTNGGKQIEFSAESNQFEKKENSNFVLPSVNRVFPVHLTSGEIFNNKLLFPYCFLEIFVIGQGLDGRGQSRDRGIPPLG